MIYCEVLLSTSTRGRELKIISVVLLEMASRSTSTRGRELKRVPITAHVSVLGSTSTRGRELKNFSTHTEELQFGRPPREVVS